MVEILQNFGVDWKLLLAQGFNFLILFFILKKFVYGPIVSILHKRKADIEKGIEFTKKAQAELDNAEAMKEEKIKEARNNALSIITEAENLADKKKAEMLKEAEEKRDSIVADSNVIIEEDRNKMLEKVYSDSELFLRRTLEKILGNMPAGERDEELIKEALNQVKGNS